MLKYVIVENTTGKGMLLHMKWRFINTDFSSGEMNMAIDEAIMEYHSKGMVPPTLRFYRWNPATISLGYFQKYDREIDIQKCIDTGMGVVRRLSGGRAVLHDNELTYSIIVSESDPMIPKSIIESYKIFSQGLLKGFSNIGIAAELSPAQSHRGRNFTSSACFDAPATYELTVGGKKIVGSSQVRQMGVVLQHGSVLNDLDADKLFSVIKMDSERAKERIRASFTDKATSIRHEKGSCESWEELCKAFFDGFRDSLGVEIELGELTEYEKERAKQLSGEKYMNDEWTLRK